MSSRRHSSFQNQQLIEVGSHNGTWYGAQLSVVANGGRLLWSSADDLLLGAPSDWGDSGYVRVARGYRPSSDSWERFGDSGSSLGSALTAGDYDGDGTRDFAAGAPGYNQRRGLLKVLLSQFSGSPYEINQSQGVVDWRLGASLATIESLDAFPGDEIIVGAPWADALTGRIQVLSVRNNSTTLVHEPGGDNAGDQFGHSVAAIGDVDGDGKADFAVGAPFADSNGVDAGTIFLYSGQSGTRLARIYGMPGDRLGISLAPAGDHNDDGVPDVLAGATHRGDGDAGAAIVFSGLTRGNGVAPPLREISGQGWVNESMTFGHAVAAGPVDADAVPDILVGAPNHDPGGRNNAGGMWVFSGATGGLLHCLEGQEAGDNMGISVAAADVNGDGRSDLAVAASGYDWGTAGSNRGRVYVFAVPGPAPGLGVGNVHDNRPGTGTYFNFSTNMAALGRLYYRLLTAPVGTPDTILASSNGWDFGHGFFPSLAAGQQYLWRYGAAANSPDTTHDNYSLVVTPPVGSGLQPGMVLNQFSAPTQFWATLYNGTGSFQSVTITELSLRVGTTTYRVTPGVTYPSFAGSTLRYPMELPAWHAGSTCVATVRWRRNGINYGKSWQVRFPQ